jgi:energy-converting hydrogenase Eha subunit C
MSDDHLSGETEGAPGVALGTLELAARTERLAPLYDAAVKTLFWGFRLGAALLALGIVGALLKREPLGHEADPIPDVIAMVRAGYASGVIDLAILWFMLTPVATVIVVAASFWRLGDRRYALLCLIVLAILGASVTLALNR